MMEDSIRAASRHTIPYTPEIQQGRFPKEWIERPLAHWLDTSVRDFWATSVTGAAGVGDCFNRLSHAAGIAMDTRYPAAVAERAAVRYDAQRAYGVCLDALKARGGDEVRACYRETCEHFDTGAADRLLTEEAMGILPSASSVGPSRGQRPSSGSAGLESLRSGLSAGAQVCLLWGLGACSKTESSCGKLHMCPYCGSTDKGCFVKHPNHMSSFKRHASTPPDAGRGRGRQLDRPEARRRRSRSRSRRGSSKPGGRPRQTVAGTQQLAPTKAERSPSR